jgi:hypothetical protein
MLEAKTLLNIARSLFLIAVCSAGNVIKRPKALPWGPPAAKLIKPYSG